jgi:ABC-type transport system involved in multi-copper enzyme maturation permease subunit
MALHLGPGPVFYYKWLTASRRPQLYAGRVLFLLALLGAIGVVWWAQAARYPQPSLQDQARVGESIFYAIVGTQLALVLLAAPAATAGSVCLDKARGTLAHLLVTDLSGAEIVLGKLAARLLTVLGLLLGTLPVLALNTLLGGLDPEALAGAFLVTVGVAVLGCALALALSVWGHKAYEVLFVNYLLWSAFLLAYPAWHFLVQELSRSLGPPGLGPPDWLLHANPFWLAFAPYASPGTSTLIGCAFFLAGCLTLAAVLTGVAVLFVRSVALRQSGRPPRRRRWPMVGLALARALRGPFSPSLDRNPVLWREWHRRRPSRWVAVVWALYAVAAVLFTGLAVILHSGSPRQYDEFPALVNAFEVVVGLLLVSVTSSTSLGEERAGGSLEVLLTTPLPTRAIVWGKWRGGFRTVLRLAVLPGLLTGVLALESGRWLAPPLVVGLVLAYGAALTSLGLALAVWVPRLGRAVALSVSAYVLLAVAWPILVFTLAGRYDPEGLAVASPFWGIGYASVWAGEEPGRQVDFIPWWAVLWIVLYLLAAGVLYLTGLYTFDRCLGRVTGKSRPPAARERGA